MNVKDAAYYRATVSPTKWFDSKSCFKRQNLYRKFEHIA